MVFWSVTTFSGDGRLGTGRHGDRERDNKQLGSSKVVFEGRRLRVAYVPKDCVYHSRTMKHPRALSLVGTGRCHHVFAEEIGLGLAISIWVARDKKKTSDNFFSRVKVIDTAALAEMPGVGEMSQMRPPSVLRAALSKTTIEVDDYLGVVQAVTRLECAAVAATQIREPHSLAHCGSRKARLRHIGTSLMIHTLSRQRSIGNRLLRPQAQLWSTRSVSIC